MIKHISQIFLTVFFFFLSIQTSKAQQFDLLNASSIPIELKMNSNGVVRYNRVHIDVKDYNKIIYTNKRIVTILNEKGNFYDRASMSYSKNKIIKKIEAKIYDAKGNEIKKIKKNDFVDVSAVPNGTLYSDNRRKYLKYIPISYPYTVVFETEVEYKSTAFIPGWEPIERFYTSTQYSDYKITNSSGIEIKIKTTNFDEYEIEKKSDFHYSAKNLTAIKPEAYSPSFKTYAPTLRAALVQFNMEGVKGTNINWEGFGKWVNDRLISGTQEIPQSAKDEINKLTSNADTKIEKAKIVYEYMQNKTRYISVQVGIGGWKPMLAGDVNKLGYGDCKALTNYTKALLDEINVESYYTLIYGGKRIINIDKEFSAAEGNHAILCIPNEDDYIWLECTSQTKPFGYNANFTDDRDALIIMPSGGKIVHTKVYNTLGNLQETKAIINLDRKGDIQATVTIETQGTQYSSHVDVQKDILKDQKLHYKYYWDAISNLDIVSMDYINDKDNAIFKESIELNVTRYVSKAGDRILFSPNMFNRISNTPPRYKNRKLPFLIERGFIDIDEFEIKLPNSLIVDALKEDVSIINKFGEYSYSIKEQSDNNLLFKRKFILNKGEFNKEDYKDFRDFWIQIVKHDKSKIALKIN